MIQVVRSKKQINNGSKKQNMCKQIEGAGCAIGVCATAQIGDVVWYRLATDKGINDYGLDIDKVAMLVGESRVFLQHQWQHKIVEVQESHINKEILQSMPTEPLKLQTIKIIPLECVINIMLKDPTYRSTKLLKELCAIALTSLMGEVLNKIEI